MAGAPVGETDNLVTGRDPFDSDADLRHNSGKVSPLTRRESGRPNRMKLSFAYFRLTRVDRSGLYLDQNFPLSWLRNRHVNHTQDVTVAVLIESNRLHAPRLP